VRLIRTLKTKNGVWTGVRSGFGIRGELLNMKNLSYLILECNKGTNNFFWIAYLKYKVTF
jgi:hypothetical protein